jgi:hypothetical protein
VVIVARRDRELRVEIAALFVFGGRVVSPPGWPTAENASPGQLRSGPAGPASDGQVEYLTDLADALGVSYPKLSETRPLASAWIDVLATRRALGALKALKPVRGDVVASNYRPDELGTVVSISEDGQINTAGSGGHRIPAHQARIAARAGDTSPEADDLRKRAANRRALRERQGGSPSPEKTKILAPYRIEVLPGPAEVALLRQAIESAGDERPVQQCLEDHPELLAPTRGAD